MNDMMTFPDTWEEYEKSYGFTDNEEIYTNGARLIPSFRAKQWLDHLPSVQPKIIRCKDCRKHNITAAKAESIAEMCPLTTIRGKAHGHEFDYQYCVYAELRGDSDDR